MMCSKESVHSGPTFALPDINKFPRQKRKSDWIKQEGTGVAMTPGPNSIALLTGSQIFLLTIAEKSA